MPAKQNMSVEETGNSEDEELHPDTSESGKLMPETEIPIKITPATPSSDDKGVWRKSMPDMTGHVIRSVSGTGLHYGSVPEKVGAAGGGGGEGCDSKKVIYCVHGKPSGCCATLVNGTGSSFPIEVRPPLDEHCHKQRNDEAMNRKARRKLITASILCVIFMFGEIVGGVLSGSLAIATDAAHLLTDFAAFMISLFAIWVGQREPTRKMLFGWHRAEVIGALTSVLTIWLVTGILVYMAALRIVNNDFEIETTVMLITSGVGVIINIIMGLTLHQHGHSHGGSTSSSSDVEQRVSALDMSKGEASTSATSHAHNINVRAAFIHVIGDFLQSIGVFIAALLIYFNEEWKIVDPICTFLFSILVLLTTYSILKDTIIVLMEGMPKDIDFNDVLETFLSIEGVVAVHNLRIWALSLGKTALATHVAIDEKASPNEILSIATRKIHEKFNFFEMTIQIEYFQAKMQNCDQCQVPK